MGLRPRKWSRLSLTVRAPCVGVGALVVGAHCLPVRRYNITVKVYGRYSIKGVALRGLSDGRGGIRSFPPTLRKQNPAAPMPTPLPQLRL